MPKIRPVPVPDPEPEFVMWVPGADAASWSARLEDDDAPGLSPGPRRYAGGSVAPDLDMGPLSFPGTAVVQLRGRLGDRRLVVQQVVDAAQWQSGNDFRNFIRQELRTRWGEEAVKYLLDHGDLHWHVVE